jgi:two-component system, chemotaxis family, sensor kinase CheA
MSKEISEVLKTKRTSIKFPLRVKILSGVLLLLALAVGTILSYSTDLILNDKRAYIFETGLQKTSNMANSFKNEIDSVLSRISVITKKSDGITVTEFFNYIGNNVYFYQIINLLDKSTSKKINPTFFQKSGIKFKYKLEKFKEFDLINLATENLPRVSIKDLTSESKFPSYAIIIHNKDEGIVNIIAIGAQTLNSKLNSNDKFTNQILDSSGLQFFKKNKSTLMSSLNSQTSNNGTIKTKGKDGNELLLSFTKLPSLGLNFLSYIHEKDAFQVATELLMRTLYFGLGLLFLFFIFGTFFSISIAKPVQQLSQATSKIAEGDFSYKIDVKTKDEFSLLGDSFNFMSTEIESLLENKEQMITKLNVANEKLEDYSKNLEKMVEKRTQELNEAHSFLSAMINSLDQGLVVFDKEVKCSNVFTQAALKLFSNNPEGMSYPKLIGITDEDEVSKVTKWAEVVFRDVIPFKSSKALGPGNIIRGTDFNDPEFSYIDLNYYPMRNQDNKIENIVAVATDKTQEIIATENFKKQESYVKMVLKMTNNKDHFLSFLEEVDQIMIKTNTLLETTKEKPDSLSIELLMINFHTLNGGFSLFSIDVIQKMARSCEQTLIDMRKEEKAYSEIHIAIYEKFIQLEVIIDEFKSSCSKIFGKKLSDLYTNKEISIDAIEKFDKLLEKESTEPISTEFKNKFINIAAKNSVIGYADLVSTLAKQLSKKVNPLVILDHGLTLPPGLYKDFFNSLVHLFRNCVDHGLESEEKRVANGKNPTGTIAVEFKTSFDNTADWIVVQVIDDGAGINPEIIRKKLLENNPDTDIDSISDTDIIYKIFDPEFSTAEVVTEFSGRGVGMSAIKEVIDEYSGVIQIESKVGSGTKFTFKLPKVS